MQTKNLARKIVTAFALFTTMLAVQAGDIYSIDFITKTGSTTPPAYLPSPVYGSDVTVRPSTTTPLKAGDEIVIRVRMIDKNWSSTGTPWSFVPTSNLGALALLSPTNLANTAYAPAIGLKLGTKNVFATWFATVDLSSSEDPSPDPNIPPNYYTDLFFSYVVKPGDIAWPVLLMTTNDGKAASETSTSYQYYLKNVGATGYWTLKSGGADADFSYSATGTGAVAPTDQRLSSISGSGMNLYINTIDFDSQMADTTNWRTIDDSGTEGTASPSTPTLVAETAPAEPATVYVWVDDESIAVPAAAVAPVAPETRHIAKITFDAGEKTKPFELIGNAVGTANVRVSATDKLETDDMGNTVVSWIEKQIRVVASVPNVTISLIGPDNVSTTDSLVCTPDYSAKVGTLRVRVSPAPTTGPLTVTVVPSVEDVDRDDIFGGTKPYLGISATTTDEPWKKSDTTLTFAVGDSGPHELYLYGLGSTNTFENPVTNIKFSPKLSGADSATYTTLNSRSATLTRVTPAITAPLAGDEIDDATLGQDYQVTLAVTGGYNDIYKSDAGTWKVNYTIEKDGSPLRSGSVTNDTINTATREITATIPRGDIRRGATDMVLWVTSPDGVASAKRSVKFKVFEPPTVVAALESADGVAVGTYAEGETASVYFRVEKQDAYSDSDAVYAFLKPTDDTIDVVTNYMTCSAFALTNLTDSAGVLIPNSSKVSSGCALIKFLDGNATSIGRFTVELCSTIKYDPDKVVDSFDSPITVTATNVVPKVLAVRVGGNTAEEGATLDGAESVPLGIEQKFSLKSLFEPSNIDRESSFKTQWYFDEDPYAGAEGDGWQDSGHPTNILKRAFITPGKRTVKVRCQDKDMVAGGEYSEEFTFYVMVNDQPKIVITPLKGAGKYSETQKGKEESAFRVTLTSAPAFTNKADNIQVDLVVTKNDPTGAYSTNDVVLSTYTIPFSNGIDGTSTDTAVFFFKQLDGTQGSNDDGFTITASVNGNKKDDIGKSWDPGSYEINISNADPTIKTVPDATADGGETEPKGIDTTIGKENEIKWTVGDVYGDKTNLTVTCMVDGNTVETVLTTNNVYSGTFWPSFSTSGESKFVLITVEDKDGGQTSAKIYYNVAPAKVLRTVAGGPAGATAKVGLSGTYARQKGRGYGHVFVSNGNIGGAENFSLFWNCGTETVATAYGYGYKVGAVDDGTLDNGYDTAITQAGGGIVTGVTPATDRYAYGLTTDSYLYGWISATEAGGTEYKMTVTPEVRGSKNSELSSFPVSLPGAKTEDEKGYDETYAEAVFATEYRPADNMGDLNNDGVPDYLATYYYQNGPLADPGEGVDGAELVAVSSSNEDEDYMPSDTQLNGSAAISGAGWEEYGQPFTATLEIRGVHPGLNFGMFQADPIEKKFGWVSDLDMSDAEKTILIEYATADTVNVAAATALTNSVGASVSAWLVLPDNPTPAQVTDYTNQQAIAKAYIDATWSGYIEGNPSTWGFTIENRTDPTVDDSDGDGISDGFEYYYWYAATVGFPNSGSTPLEGSKFNLSDLENPTAITSAEIVSLFNPSVAAPVDWKKRDSDSDGLYDFEEYAIGTNPVHWDTDKDGLSDLFEIMWNVDAFKGPDDSASNGGSNADGDYMAVVQGYKTCPIVNVTALGKNYAKVATVTNYVDSGTNFEVAVGFEAARFNGGWIPTASAFSESDERGVTFVLWDDPGTSTANYTTVTTSGRIDLYHNQVYSYYGFDPRTGWFKPDRDYGNEYPNSAKFTAKDEFLLLKYRYITGLRTLDNTDPNNKGDLQKLADDETTIAAIFKAGTTNPSASFEEKTYGSESASYIRTASELHGADSDGDAVPDGWELYVGANPNVKDTSDTKTVGTKLGLLAKEFAGTTCSAIYSACPTIVANRPKAEGSVIFGWLNKFWPVDPGSDDTDGDGITDKEEGNASWSEKLIYGRWGQTKVSNIGGTGVFVSHRAQYGDVNDVDDDDDVRPSYKGCYAGGGYNPCSIDTDKDGLPDRWERQYSGVLFYRDDFADNAFAEGSAIPDPDVDDEKRASIHAYYNPLSSWGYYVAMGMDATVPDSQADFDFDGLTNWQEYMVQALRHLRYDDCVHPLNGYDMPTVNALTDSTVPGNFTGKYFKLSLAEGYDELSGTDRDAVLGTILDLGYTNFVNFISSEAGEDYLVKLGYFGKPSHDWDPANSISGSTTVSVTDETGTTTTTESEGFRYMRPPRFAKLSATEVYDYTNKDGDGNEIWTGFENTLTLVGGVPVFTPTATPITFTNVAGSVAAPVGTVGSVMQFSGLPASLVGSVYTNALLVVTNYTPTLVNRYYMLESPVLASNVVMTTWSSAIKFVSTDPRLWDTDEDGQDDYWELFHGLNPLLGSATDVIADAYVFGISSTENAFTGWADMSDTPPYDPIKTPWLVGAADADADGDGLRNYEEGLLVNLTEPTSTHTDPTPLWMTDTTIPAVEIPVTAEEETVETIFIDYGGITVPYSQSVTNTVTNSFVTVYQSPSYAAQFYEVPWTGNNNWVDEGYFLDFEENEGYDTDGDWRSDRTELTRGVEPISDPLAFGDPSSRQSVTLGDGGMEGVLIGYSPIERSNYVRNADFLKHFTVEAWINPASTTTGTKQYVVSRAVNTAGWDTFNTAPVIRHNFAIGIASNGCVFAEFDDSTDGTAYAEGGAIASGKWTHVAATYDGEILRVMVDGAESGEAPTKEIPVTGAKGILQDAARDRVVDFPVAGYSCDPAVIIIGGRAIGNGSFGAEVAAAATNWNDVATDFFKGSVDEVRVWHGARTAAQVEADRKTRFSTEQVKELRLANLAGEYGDVELVHHYNFSTLPGAEAKLHVQQMPAGFTNNVLAAVNTDVGTDALKVGWWNAIVTNSVFAGQVYRSGHIVPWVKDTVGHLPALLGEVSDSEFWTEYLAGYTPVTFQGVDKFEFPNSMNPYTLVRRPSIVLSAYHTKYQEGNYTDAELYSTLDFLGKYDARHAFSGTKDLVPIGDVYAKRLTDSWDGQGAETAWAVTTDNSALNPDGDENDDGIPAWAVTAGYVSARDYARALAKGLLPTGAINANYENTEDVDGDGLRDWWEKFFGIYDEGPNDDHDRDGLSNYQEYLIGEVYTSFGFGELSPIAAYSKGTSVTDYFLRYNSLYLGELFSDHDMIEDEFEDYMPSVTSLGGTLVSNFSRWIYDADWDAKRDGWDNWSIARAWFNESYVSNVVTEVGGVAVTNEYLFSKLDDNNGNPSPKINICVSYKYTGRCPEIGSPTKSHQFVVKAWNLENGKADEGFASPDCTWGGKLEGEGGYFTLTGTANGYFASQGAVKPGRNMFVAYIAEGDFEEGGTAPSYQPGMPYGVAYGVEVGSIGGGTVNIELTDTNPSVVRIDIPAAVALVYGGGNQTVASGSTLAETLFEEIAKGYTDRGRHEPDMLRIPDYIGEDTKLTVSNIHVRILRAGMNGEQETNGGLPLSRKDVLLDRNFRIGVNHVLTEADLLASLPSGEGDLDWGLPQYNNMSTEDFTNALYRVVVGDGTVSGDEENNNLIVMFYNKFELGLTQSPVANMSRGTFAGRPTFSWTHTNTIGKDYPAFRLRVWDGGTPIYDSGVQRAPVRDQAGYYNWAPPLYVGEMLDYNKVFEPNKDYKWSVSMLDAKFTTPLANEEQKTFKMQETSSGPGSDDYGIIKVVVKYMGPGAVSTNTAAKCIRVEAFTTPDFTGEPAGVGFVTDATTINSTTNLDINARVVGLPQKDDKGRTVQYYVRAFLDTDVASAEGGYGERAPWESWGYASYRDPKQDRYDCFTPCAITATNNEKAEPCVVFIEDCDTNRNMVPDILETSAAGATTLYSPYIAYTASDAVKTNALVSATNGANGDKDSVKRTRALLAFASAVEAAESGTVTAGELAVLYGGISFETVDSANIKITSFSLDDGISLEVNIEGTFAGAVSAGYDTGLINVTVEYSKTLENGGVWQRAGDVVTLSFSLTQPTTKIEATELVAIKAAIKDAKDDGGRYFRVSAVAFER